MHFSFVEKFGASVLMTVWLVWGSIMVGNVLVRPNDTGLEALRMPGIEEKASAPAAAAKETADTAMTLLAQASPEAGEKTFKKNCSTCHGAEKGGKHKIGPNLWDVVGRKKASAAGFSYSGALAGLGGEWTYEDINKFITNPAAFAKGNKMTFAGVKTSDERAAVIAYLRGSSDSPKPLP